MVIYRYLFIIFCCGLIQCQPVLAKYLPPSVSVTPSVMTIPNIEVELSTALGTNSTTPFLRTNDNVLHLVYYNRFRGQTDIFYTRSIDNGNSWSTPINISENPGESRNPTLVTDEHNNLFLFWENDGQVFFTQSNNSGQSWEAVFTIGTDIPQALNISAAADIDGNVHVVWDNKGSIFYRNFSSTKKSWSDIFNLSMPYESSETPALAIDEQNNVHIAWITQGKTLYRRKNSVDNQWSKDIFDLSGNSLLTMKEIRLPAGENNKNAVYRVEDRYIDISGKSSRLTQVIIALSIGNENYETSVDANGNYLFKGIKLEENDNSYSITAKVPDNRILLCSGFIQYKVPQSSAPQVIAGKKDRVIVAWHEKNSYVFKVYQDGQWSPGNLPVALETMPWLGISSLAIDNLENSYATWIYDSKLYWRQFAQQNIEQHLSNYTNTLSQISFISGTLQQPALNPKFIGCNSEVFNVIKPLNGFELVWLEKHPKKNRHQFKFLPNAEYATITPMPTNIVVYKEDPKSLTVQWNPYRLQTGFQLLISQNPDFTSPLLYDSGLQRGNSNIHKIPIRLTNGTHYVKVRLSNQGLSWGPYSEPESYTASETEVPVPYLVSLPKFLAEEITELTWKMNFTKDTPEDFQPDQLEIECAKDPEFREIVIRSGWEPVLSYQYRNMEDGIYYFRVRGRNSFANNKKSPWSNIVFTTIDRTPPRITSVNVWLNTPGNGLYLPPSFQQDFKAYFNHQLKGKTLYIRPKFEETNPSSIEANKAFNTRSKEGDKTNNWTISYAITTANIADQKVVLTFFDKAGNSTPITILFKEDNASANILGSWKTTSKDIVAVEDKLYSKEASGNANVFLSGICIDYDSGLNYMWMEYKGTTKDIEIVERKWTATQNIINISKPNTIMVYAQDRVGNITQKSFNTLIDDTPPQVTFHSAQVDSPFLFYSKEANTVYVSPKYSKTATLNMRGFSIDKESGPGLIRAPKLFGTQGKVKRYKSDASRWQVSYLLSPKAAKNPKDVQINFYDKLGNQTRASFKLNQDKIPPPPPRNVRATPFIEQGRIEGVNLTWDESTDLESGTLRYYAGLDPKWDNNEIRASNAGFKLEPGWHTFYVYAVDNVGNVSLPGTDTLEVHPSHPRLLFPEENATINIQSPLFRWTRTVADGYYIIGIAENAQFTKNARSFKAEVEKFNLPNKEQLKKNQDYYWRVQAFDSQGEIFSEADKIVPSRFSVDLSGPQNIGFLIGDGEQNTSQQSVTISLQGAKTAEIIIAESFDFEGAKWQEFQPTINFNLSSEDGKKMIYIKFRDFLGTRSAILSQPIILDTKAPELYAQIKLAEDKLNNKTEAKVQLYFSETVSFNFSTIKLELLDKFSLAVNQLKYEDNYWEGSCVLPKGNYNTESFLLHLKGAIADNAGNSLKLPLTYAIAIDNQPPSLNSFVLYGPNPARFGDHLQFSLKGSPGCKAEVKLGTLRHIPLPEVSSGNYSGFWNVDTQVPITDIPVIAILQDAAGNKSQSRETSLWRLNPPTVNIFEDFSKTFSFPFKSQTYVVTNPEIDKKLQVLQIAYKTTKQQLWAACSIPKQNYVNLSGYKPSLRFWLKGSGSKAIAGQIHLRSGGEQITKAKLESAKGYSFSVDNNSWQLMVFPLSAIDANKLPKLAFLDFVFSSPNPEDGVIYIDDLTISSSVL